jgi:hypothetical protein
VTDADVQPLEEAPPRLPAAAPEWRLDSVAGRVEPEPYRLRSAAFLPDGRVVVMHAAGRELLLLDTAGALVRTIGRAGSGPGEFRAVASVFALPTGHLVAFDPVQRRAIRFDTLGAALEQRSLAVPPTESGTFRPDADWGVAADGDLLVTASRAEASADTTHGVTVRRFWRGAEDGWRRAAADAAVEDSTRALPGGGLTLVPFATQPLAAVCGDDLVLADAQSLRAPRVQRVTREGALRVQTSIAVTPRLATDADFRDWLADGMPPGEPVPDEFVALISGCDRRCASPKSTACCVMRRAPHG